MTDTADRYRCFRSLYKQAEDAIHNLGIEGSGTDILARVQNGGQPESQPRREKTREKTGEKN